MHDIRVGLGEHRGSVIVKAINLEPCRCLPGQIVVFVTHGDGLGAFDSTRGLPCDPGQRVATGRCGASRAARAIPAASMTETNSRALVRSSRNATDNAALGWRQ